MHARMQKPSVVKILLSRGLETEVLEWYLWALESSLTAWLILVADALGLCSRGEGRERSGGEMFSMAGMSDAEASAKSTSEGTST